MKLTLRHLLVLTLMIPAFMACNEVKETQSKFQLNGMLEGITDGKVFLSSTDKKLGISDTALIKNGSFVFKGNYPTPIEANLKFENCRGKISLFVENSQINLTGDVKSLYKAKVIGCKTLDDRIAYFTERKAIEKQYRSKIPKRGTSNYEEVKNEMIQKEKEANKALDDKFIKENPTSHYSAIIVKKSLYAKSAQEIEQVIAKLDPRLQTNPIIKELSDKMNRMKEVEIGIDKIMLNASNVSYKVDEKFNGKAYKDIVYLAAFENNNICALKKDGTVQIMDAKGKEINRFKTELEGRPSSIAVDKADNIYVLLTLQEKKTRKVRGKSRDFMIAKGVDCHIFNKNGKQLLKYNLPGLITASGARVADNNLIVSDCKSKQIAMFNLKTGEAKSSIQEMRPCCGILDFSVNAKNEILVANLGAFRVQGFDLTGKNIVAFGQRGKGLDDFHGCCNPVSVTNLSNGAIVTVEKDPTRIKVYSKEGAKQIDGIEELVKGCTYIPMIVDSNDNLYLASGEKGMVKCISVI